MNIENLSNEKKEESINYIIQQGVVTPKKHFENLKNKIKVCNIKIAFSGIHDCIFLGIVTGLIFWFLFLQVKTELIGCGVYLLSPLIYIAIYSLVVWKEMILKLYEMKMVCKYNLQLLSTIRMLYVSMVNLFCNTIAIWILKSMGAKNFEFGRLLGISFSATFLYGIVSIFLRWKKGTIVSQLKCSVAWLVANALLIIFGGRAFEKFLLHLPEYIVVGMVVISCILYITMLFFNVSKRIEGEMEYAFD